MSVNFIPIPRNREGTFLFKSDHSHPDHGMTRLHIRGTTCIAQILYRSHIPSVKSLCTVKLSRNNSPDTRCSFWPLGAPNSTAFIDLPTSQT